MQKTTYFLGFRRGFGDENGCFGHGMKASWGRKQPRKQLGGGGTPRDRSPKTTLTTKSPRHQDTKGRGSMDGCSVTRVEFRSHPERDSGWDNSLAGVGG